MSNTHLHNDVLYPHRTHIISDLVNGRCVPGPIWKKREYRLKFLLRSLLFWSSTRRMLEALSGRDDFDRLLAAQITLPSKTHRQYLMRGQQPIEVIPARECLKHALYRQRLLRSQSRARR